MKYKIVSIGNFDSIAEDSLLEQDVTFIYSGESMEFVTREISKADKVIFNISDITLYNVTLLGISLAKSKPVFASSDIYQKITAIGLQHNLIFNVELDEAIDCDLGKYLGYDVNCRTHVMINAIEKENGINKTWKCEYCDEVGSFDTLETIACSHEYLPCDYCGRTVICAENCGNHMLTR